MKLRLEIAPCEELSVACESAQRLADASQTSVHFEFNGVQCVAVPGGDAEVLAERQSLAQATVLVVRSKGGSTPELIFDAEAA